MAGNGKRRQRFILPVVLLVLSAGVVAAAVVAIRVSPTPPGPSPSPRSDLVDFENFHRVSDSVYRGGRPTPANLRQLKGVGVRTVIDVAGIQGEAEDAKAAGLGYVCIRAGSFRPPEQAMVDFLRVISDARREPFLVHCVQGTYRTGAMIALYRIAVQGWDRKRAIAEAVGPMFGFDASTTKEFAEFINSLDIEQLKRDAARPPATQPLDIE